MEWFEALILGFIQGLTEYLPVSSSGHLLIGKEILGVDVDGGGTTFEVLVHVATVLSTIVILWKEVTWIFKGLFKKPIRASVAQEKTNNLFGWHFNMEQRYVFMIIISMIPIGIVGVFFKDYVDTLFEGDLLVVGICLLATALLLTFSQYFSPKKPHDIKCKDAFIIGLSQAVAVLPGLSRSGTTIATGLLLGNSREQLAQFSFLMVIPPILGEALLDAKDIFVGGMETISVTAMIVGFLAAFVSGCIACKAMIALVKRCKLVYFAIYCALVGILAIVF
jgi:undecaprenyl-diphosphatase